MEEPHHGQRMKPSYCCPSSSRTVWEAICFSLFNFWSGSCNNTYWFVYPKSPNTVYVNRILLSVMETAMHCLMCVCVPAGLSEEILDGSMYSRSRTIPMPVSWKPRLSTFPWHIGTWGSLGMVKMLLVFSRWYILSSLSLFDYEKTDCSQWCT